MAVVPARQSVSSSKLYRFAPTRQLHADYEAVVPATIRDGNNTRVLREFLRLREEENVTGAEKEYPVILPSVDSPADAGCGEDRLQGPLFRKIAVLRRALYLAGKESKEAEDGLRVLVQSARESPGGTARILSRHMPDASRQEESVSTGEVKCAGGVCSRQALPYSRFCLQHISKDKDQVLYGSCTASEVAGVPCGATVFDFLLNQPLCSKHVTKAALERPVQQLKKKTVVTNRTTKAKGKGQKTKKTKATTKLAVPKPLPATSTALPTLLSSTGSWSSGESDGEHPVISEAKRMKVAKPPPPNSEGKIFPTTDHDRLPSLTPEALDLSLSTIPLPSLILPPPLPDIGKFMDDSSSEEDS